jgi:hypothetical protein
VRHEHCSSPRIADFRLQNEFTSVGACYEFLNLQSAIGNLQSEIRDCHTISS